MALSSELNSSYRPSSALVTEKYTPLLNIKATKSDKETLKVAANNRIKIFQDIGIQVSRITYLSTESMGIYAAKELNKNSPLVVVSSNRSGWIKKGYDKANKILEESSPPITNFNTVTDPLAFKNGAVPFYLPVRMSAQEAATRNVYIFVASDEYQTYYNALKDTNMTVIGWRTEGNERLSGFGASRYAALEFFKHLNKNYNKCNSIWMLDDNVAYINTFPGLATVEANLGTFFGLGFRGGTVVKDESDFLKIAKTTIHPPVAGNAYKDAPILQQAVLWNIKAFVADNYSFSPYFITSAEDTSLTKFLGLKKCKYYSGCEIIKGMTAPDNGLPARVFQAEKLNLISYCYKAKDEIPFSSPAVPDIKTLSGVITAAREALTSPPKIPDIADQENISQTYSKAVEQILSAALDQNVPLPEGLFSLPVPSITTKLMPK